MPAGDRVTDADCDCCAKVKRKKSPAGRQRTKLKENKKRRNVIEKSIWGFVPDSRQMSAAFTFPPEG